MSSFEVTYGEVECFSRNVAVLDGASGRASLYSHYLVFQSGVGDLLGQARNLLSDDHGTVMGACDYLQLIARVSADQLDRAASYYQHTDHRVAVKQDANYPK